jgi:5'-3' exonuclease
MTFDVEAFEERSAIMEFDGGLSRFRAETLAAQAQGVARHVAIRISNSQQARDQRPQAKRNGSDNLPGMQPEQAKEKRSVLERDVQGGRGAMALLAL